MTVFSRRRKPSGSSSDPSLQLAQHDMRDHRHALLAVIEARDGGEVLAARMMEVLGVLARDLLQGFQAVRRKTRRDDRKVLYATRRQRLHGHVGVRLQPFGKTEARLEREHEMAFIKTETRAEKPRRLVALAVIRIALDEVFLRHAM